MEAVKQGSAAVGLKSKTHTVLLALKVTPQFSILKISIPNISKSQFPISQNPFFPQRSSSELASYQKKVFKIDEHVGIAIAGLTSDARVLRFWFSSPFPCSLVSADSVFSLSLSLSLSIE